MTHKYFNQRGELMFETKEDHPVVSALKEALCQQDGMTDSAKTTAKNSDDGSPTDSAQDNKLGRNL